MSHIRGQKNIKHDLIFKHLQYIVDQNYICEKQLMTSHYIRGYSNFNKGAVGRIVLMITASYFPSETRKPYLLTVGQDFPGIFEATLSALRIQFPLATLQVHVQYLTATEHGDLWLCQLGTWFIHLSHWYSLESIKRVSGRDTREVTAHGIVSSNCEY